MYSLVILLLHQNWSPWPIVGLQALLTAWTVWLVVRSLSNRPVPLYFGLIAGLCFFTSIGWYVSFLTPDSLGPVLYLCLYLLVFASELLRPWEAVGVIAIAWWSTTSHSTHLLLACAVCGFLCLLWLCRWDGIKQRGSRILLISGIVLTAILSQTMLHGWIYRKPSVFGAHPPFLMARAIADGPARLYLQQNCSKLGWTICTHVHNLPTSDSAFLWQPDGIWLSSTLLQQNRLSQEELPLVLATLRTYPLAQARCSLQNFLYQLITMGPQDFDNWSTYTPAFLNSIIPGLHQGYSASRQSQDAMPQRFFRLLQIPVVILSTLAIILLLPWAWRYRQLRLLGLTYLVMLVVPANALVTGVLAGIYARYQGRVVWLLPLAATLMASSYWTSRHSKAYS